MVGHFLNVLGPEAETRLLTEPLAPVEYVGQGQRCVVGCAFDLRWVGKELYPCPETLPTLWRGSLDLSVENRYDELCHRFGTARVNAAVRDRILRNQLYRTLGRKRGRPVR